jgi:AcrR family transcriptional regulator
MKKPTSPKNDAPVLAAKKVRGPSKKVTEQLLLATLELLEEQGAAGLKIEAIADKAGVHKSTLYRRYGDTRTLVKAVIAEIDHGGTAIPDTGSLYTDMHALAHSFAVHFRQPAVTAINRLIAGNRNSDPQLADWMDDYWQGRQDLYQEVLKRAEARGEPLDAEKFPLAVEIIVGPMALRSLMTNHDIDAATVAQLADVAYRHLTS